MKIFIKLLLSIGIYFLVGPLILTAEIKDDDKIIIENISQKISFKYTKSDGLVTKVEVKMKIKSNTDLTVNFAKSIFVDEHSKILSIFYKDEKKGVKSRRIIPKLTDYVYDGVFHSDIKVCNFNKTLLTKGQQIEFKFVKQYTDYKFLYPIYFNDAYKIENSEVEISVPAWLDLDIREWNFDKEQPAVENVQDKNEKVYKYKLKNLSAAFRDKAAPRRSKINAHLIMVPNSMVVKGKTTRLMQDVSDLYNWYHSLVQEIGNENEDLKKIVNEIVSDKTSDVEKIKAIFYWVQDNIKYIAFEYGIMGFRPQSCQEVYNNKYGDCKGMANLTKEMLILAGYDARLTWIGTADLPYNYDLPSLIVDNHMICSMMLDGKRIFLDATEKYADLYNYAYRIQGRQVLIENGEKYFIEEVPKHDTAYSKEVVVNKLKIKNSQLVGTGIVTYTGNRKTYMLNHLAAVSNNERVEELTGYLSNYDKNVKIKLAQKINFENRDEDLQFDYQVEVDNHIVDIGNEFYLNPELEFQFQNFEMKPDRMVPYDFSSTFQLENNTLIEIPSGWIVNYLPVAVEVDHDNYYFNLSYKQTGNKIEYQKKIEMKNSILLVNDFKEWNELITKLNVFFSDQIILQKN